MTSYEDHPIAGIFPLLPDAEIAELSDAIHANGQRETVVLFEGKILDGRNRHRACTLAGIETRTRVFDPKRDGTSALRFVLDTNLHRRHLTTGQRAIIAAESLKALQMEAKMAVEAAADQEDGSGSDDAPENVVTDAPFTGVEEDGTLMGEAAEDGVAPTPTVSEIAETAGVSERSVHTATKLIEDDPEEAEQVKAGEKSLNAGKEDAAAKEKAEQLEKERKALKSRIRKVCGSDFGDAFVEGTVLKTAAEQKAFAALDDDVMKLVAPLVATGWKVKRAAAHVTKTITGDTCVTDLVNHAIANDNKFEHVHEGEWEISVVKVSLLLLAGCLLFLVSCAGNDPRLGGPPGTYYFESVETMNNYMHEHFRVRDNRPFVAPEIAPDPDDTDFAAPPAMP